MVFHLSKSRLSQAQFKQVQNSAFSFPEISSKEKELKAVFILCATLAFGDKYDRFLGPESIRDTIQEICAETGVPVNIAAGLLWSESGGDPKCVTDTSLGYWQLNRLYHKDFSRLFWYGAEFD